MSHTRRIDALRAALTSTDDGPPPDIDWLVEQAANPTIDCACCRPWLDAFTENVRTYLATDPDYWDHVAATPLPPMPLHLADTLTARSP